MSSGSRFCSSSPRGPAWSGANLGWPQSPGWSRWLTSRPEGDDALLKPQIGLPPVLYLLLRDGRRGAAFGVAAAVLISATAMAPSGLERVPGQALSSLHAHAALDFNAPSRFYDVAALLSPLATGSTPAALSAVLGIALIA